MRIAIIGAGALGTFYGCRLARAGADVHFLLRSDFQTVRRRGFIVESIDGDFTLPDVQAYDDPKGIGACDLVIVGLKTTDNDRYGELITPVLADDGAVLTLQNGLGNEDHLAALFGRERVMGGTAFLCSNRIAPGHIRHTEYGTVKLAELQPGLTPRLERIAALFRQAGVDAEPLTDLVWMRWSKLVWNVPFNALAVVAGGAPVDRILADARLVDLARTMMEETRAGAAACGADIAPALVEEMIEKTGTMGPYKPSMLVDFETRRPLEVEAIVGEPVRRGEAAGAAMPCARSVYQLLQHLDRWNRMSVRSG